MRQDLRSARLKKGLSVADMAGLTGVKVRFYHMVEAGTRNPRMPMAFTIARLLGRTVEELFPDLVGTAYPSKSTTAEGR